MLGPGCSSSVSNRQLQLHTIRGFHACATLLHTSTNKRISAAIHTTLMPVVSQTVLTCKMQISCALHCSLCQRYWCIPSDNPYPWAGHVIRMTSYSAGQCNMQYIASDMATAGQPCMVCNHTNHTPLQPCIVQCIVHCICSWVAPSTRL